MYVSHLVIKNFRAIDEIECVLGPSINVLVGPNAVGKTTILQAIRVAKAILAPRTEDEAFQVLISLNAASPHFRQRLYFHSLARDVTKPIEIRCTFSLSPEECAILSASIPTIVQTLVANSVGQGFANPAALVQFLQSQRGQEASAAALKEVTERIDRLDRDPTLLLGVSLDSARSRITAVEPIAGPLIALLDQRLPPSTTIFSYFPADRALPSGEVNLQLGGPDAQQQLNSHNANPQQKYLRLKNLIIGSLVVNDDKAATVQSEFEKIFSGLLRGRRIKTIAVNELGLLSIMTEETATKRLIELDSLSSGEKNIALTFLILARSVSPGGIALFDEPELHLNPAVSREVLSFIMENYAKPRKIQFLMCTHSPEILSAAFTNEECTLLHIKSSSNVSRVGKRAMDEYADALLQLGTSVSETLLYEGTILVEGDDDVSFLQDGFPDLLKKFKVKDRGGRKEIEKAINQLQSLEKKGEKVAPIFLIFDRDEEPSSLSNSPAVKVHQWNRRCMENYLIDSVVITELLKDTAVTRSPVNNEGEVHKLLRQLAFKQIDLIAAREAYSGFGYIDSSLRKEELQYEGITELAAAFYARMSSARLSLPETTEEAWLQRFEAAVKARREGLLLTWEAKWPELCDGKRLMSDLHKAVSPKMSLSAFKTRIVQRMRETSSENWRLVRDILSDLIGQAA